MRCELPVVSHVLLPIFVIVLEVIFCLQSAVWTMKFSQCGRLLATGGQDNLLYIWTLKDAFTYFDEMRRKYSEGECAICWQSKLTLNY